MSKNDGYYGHTTNNQGKQSTRLHMGYIMSAYLLLLGDKEHKTIIYYRILISDIIAVELSILLLLCCNLHNWLKYMMLFINTKNISVHPDWMICEWWSSSVKKRNELCSDSKWHKFYACVHENCFKILSMCPLLYKMRQKFIFPSNQAILLCLLIYKWIACVQQFIPIW